ncbi:sigma-70 family RNA polymerase sigma factor [Polyangium sp. 6x1]|uniref:sigma-70 family RNA polymerase sigma factor n=1 Tax=Polyangium sp. 6x1 TaxID=3042689 RepID=UPI0024826DA9|nr:sigma-70 family RNA polymerase sigma factor [Polyangium sp. 6x1]MDI1442870.1 sigma-70 family RNA polymerase sigma factor [Polyangium sp. 6x1]
MLAAVDTTPTREEFRTFYVENFHGVWRQLRRLGVREADASDLTHDVLVLAYNHFDEIPAYAQTWLARVCFEMVRNYRRKAARRRERLAPKVIEAAIDEQTEDESPTEIVLEALDRMPEEQRMLLLRYHVREEPLHALAKSLGVARSTVQLRLAAAERAFEGWMKTLLGVDPGTGSRQSLFASFSLAELLPRAWESSEVLQRAQLDGWERLARAIDAAKITAGAPKREAPPSIEAGVGTTSLPFKVAIAFAVAAPAALAGMLIGHLGAGVAWAQSAAAPSLHAAVTQVAVIADAVVVKTAPQGDSTAASVAPAPSPAATSKQDTVPLEVKILRKLKQAVIDGQNDLAHQLLAEHRRRWSDSSHEIERQRILAAAQKIKASNETKKAAKNQAKAEDKPKP